MNLDPVPSNLIAQMTAKSNPVRCDDMSIYFYNQCLKKIKKGRFRCSLDTYNIPRGIMIATKIRLESAGYKISFGYEMFVIINPFVNKMQS
jgi:hypothetical protein